MSKNNYTVARKSIWYVMRALIIVLLVVFLAYAGFSASMYISNMYILATEGMQLRAECILQDAAVAEMSAYFSEDFINGDAALTAGTYSSFTITDFNYNITIDNVRVLPFASTGRMRVTERVTNLSGTFNDETVDPVPALTPWQAAQYDIVFKKTDGRWFIDAIELVQLDPEPKVKGTPDLSLLSEPTDG